ncbi:ABC transporter substrate-binding protein [soil metagenome]
MNAPALHLRRRALTLMLAGIGALAALAPAAAQAQNTKVRFTLDWRIDGPGAIMLLAKSKGYFAAEKLDVEIDAGNGSAAAMQRIVAGTHDIGFADTSSLVEFLGNNPGGPKIQAVYMLLDKTPATAFALKSSGIKTPADMLGKRLGSPVFDAGRKTWPMFAKANRLDPSKATWTNADPALRETLLAKGDLDVITGFYYTSVLNLEARGIKESELVVFKYADYGVNLYGNAVVVSPKFAAEHPEAVAGFLRALNRSIKETIADPKAAIAYVKEREPIIDSKLEERRLRYFLDNFVATPTVKANGLGGIDPARMRTNIVQIVDAFGLKQYPDADQLFNASFLPAAKDRKL